MRFQDEKTKAIWCLIAAGENLDPDDLEAFYRWLHDSYEALGFDPLQQHRFEDYCRSSNDSISMRVFVGVWILKLALGDFTSQERLPESLRGAVPHPVEEK